MNSALLGAVVLTGGTAVRLAGADKASIEIGSMTLLERCLAALIDIPEIVVVGETVRTTRPVTFVREDPAGGGPAAGLLAGLSGFPRAPEWMVTLAVDMPYLTASSIRRMVEARAVDGAVLTDEDGQRQHLCAVYSTTAIERTRPAYEDENGLAMRQLVGELDLVEVPAIGHEARDVDSWDDLRAIREDLDRSDP